LLLELGRVAKWLELSLGNERSELNTAKSYELLVVTGMSGAGRSTVANALEDMDWYVVDNLPPQMLKPMAELFSMAEKSLPRLAVVIDARGGGLFEDLSGYISELQSSNIDVQVLFLEANDATLIKRFEQVRRPHPLQGDGTISDGIAIERARLLPLREQADLIIDSSDLNVYQLGSKIAESFSTEQSNKLKLMIQSFGFKYGSPSDADLIADMRFIPNPYWNEELRPYNGEDKQVADYVLAQEGAEEFISNYVAALKPVLLGYQRENRKRVSIGIGCTGGKHRSVATAIEVAKRLSELDGIEVSIKHRDLGKE
jgi:RNase adapter protein RapZ